MNRLDDRIEKVNADISALQIRLGEKKALLQELKQKKKDEELKKRIAENEKIRVAFESHLDISSLEECMKYINSDSSGSDRKD